MLFWYKNSANNTNASSIFLSVVGKDYFLQFGSRGDQTDNELGLKHDGSFTKNRKSKMEKRELKPVKSPAAVTNTGKVRGDGSLTCEQTKKTDSCADLGGVEIAFPPTVGEAPRD